MLEASGVTLSDIGAIEINEAFAAQVIACQRAFESNDFACDRLGRSSAVGAIDPAKTNVNGGAIALGHPLGATGAIIIIKALYELERIGGKRALVTMGLGGCQGIALAFERI